MKKAFTFWIYSAEEHYLMIRLFQEGLIMGINKKEVKR